MITRSFKKMLIVDSVKKNSKLWTWLLRKNDRFASKKLAQRLVIAAAKKFSCSACEESQRRRLRPVAARVLHEPGTSLQVDQFEWRHPVLNLHVLGTIMVDAGSRAASVTIHRVMDVEHGLGNVTREIMLATLLSHWVKYHGKPDILRTDPEGAFPDQGFRRGLAARSIRLDIALGSVLENRSSGENH